MAEVFTLELVVLGTGAAYPGPHQACSGYLVKEGETSLLLDCGNGVISRLQDAGELDRVSALLFSHLHADHCSDIFPLFYWKLFGTGKNLPPLPIFLPPGETDRLDRIAEALRVEPRRLVESAFTITEYDPSAGLMLGGLRVSFASNVHPIPTYSVRVDVAGGSLTYTSDTGPFPGLASLASGCQLLLAEAALTEEDYDPENPVHLTPRLAAELALEAGVRRLLLTHIWPHYDRQAMLEQARKHFPATELAEELRRYPVP